MRRSTTAWSTPSWRLVERDSVRRPVRHEDRADEARPRHAAPGARVAGVLAVVADEEVVVLRHVPRAGRRVAELPVRVVLLQRPAVDRDHAAVLGHGFPRQPDQPLDERAALAALLHGELRRLEDDDLAALRVLEAVDEAEIG